MMTEEEFIKQAQLDWEEEEIKTLKDALEVCCMNGMYDDIGGDSESPTGHFYRIEQWIVITDSRGNSTVHGFDSVELAEKEMEKLNVEYSEWDV